MPCLACMQDKQLMDLMRSLSHDGNSTLYGNKSPGDSVVSMGLDSSSAPYNSSNSAMSGIQVSQLLN